MPRNSRFALLALVPALVLSIVAQAKDKPSAVPAGSIAAQQSTDIAIDRILAGAWRDPKNAARDRYRHPKQTLEFFGAAPTQTLIEITPGGGWYSEILAPLLMDHGTYIAALVKPAKPDGEAAQDKSGLAVKFATDAAHFGNAKTIQFDPKAPVFGAPGSADIVLTFRNVHNWVMGGTTTAMFKGSYTVLKPGGVLGITDHRAPAGPATDGKHGYLTEQQVIDYATAAGFKLVGKSEINANPKDLKDYPDGVWTLPPSLQLGEKDKAKYLQIGESDRMSLKFLKPPIEAKR